jgi:hypothetical protein
MTICRVINVITRVVWFVAFGLPRVARLLREAAQNAPRGSGGISTPPATCVYRAFLASLPHSGSGRLDRPQTALFNSTIRGRRQ